MKPNTTAATSAISHFFFDIPKQPPSIARAFAGFGTAGFAPFLMCSTTFLIPMPVALIPDQAQALVPASRRW